jgi:hypothetical protein
MSKKSGSDSFVKSVVLTENSVLHTQKVLIHVTCRDALPDLQLTAPAVTSPEPSSAACQADASLPEGGEGPNRP